MAIDSNALTLGQYAIMSNDPLVQAITMSLIDNGAVITDIPLVNKATLVANGVRWEGNLPTVNWAKINEEGSTTSGTPTPFQEQAYIIRNNIDVDKALVLDVNAIQDPRSAQVEAYMKAVAYDFNDKFINNTHTSGDIDAIVGIRARIDNPTQYGVRSANKIDAGGATTDLSLSGMTATTANKFFEKLDELLWSVDSPDGQGVVLYTNEVLKRRLATAARLMGTSGGFTTTRDQFDRTIEMYRGAVIRDVGYKADQTTRIITVTETAAGVDGASTFSSIYAVKFDMTHLFGWQYEPLRAKDLGLLENGVIYRTFVDWIGGLYSANTRSMARLYDIKVS
jgi:hypothetical protein